MMDGELARAPERPAVAEAGAPEALARRVMDNLRLVVHAPEETLRLVVLCLLAEGHLIIEDFPGGGKTTLAKAISCPPTSRA